MAVADVTARGGGMHTLRIALLVLLVAATLSGCVGKPVPSRPIFVKPGATSAQIEVDEARCIVQSIGDDRPGVQLQPVVAIDREAVYKCMQSKGYLVRRPV
jgi:hypothetical protein